MGSSLQDQLLKAGLVSRQKAKETRADKRKGAKQERHSGSVAVDSLQDETRRATAEKAERDRLLNRERQAAAEQRAREAEVEALILSHRIPREGGELPYHFADGAVLKKLLITKPLRDRLAAGSVAIARTRQGYELVSAEVAERVRARRPEAILVLNDSRPTAEEEEHPVPDDLTW